MTAPLSHLRPVFSLLEKPFTNGGSTPHRDYSDGLTVKTVGGDTPVAARGAAEPDHSIIAQLTAERDRAIADAKFHAARAQRAERELHERSSRHNEIREMTRPALKLVRTRSCRNGMNGYPPCRSEAEYLAEKRRG